MELKNKTILFLGSSVTYGSAAGGVSFVDIIQSTLGCRCIKEAVSGTTLADIGARSYPSRLRAMEKPERVDLFVCQLSTNDATQRIERSKTEAAIRCILEYVQSSFHCPIVFYTGTRFDSPQYEQLIALLYELQTEYAFEILDLFYDESMSSVDREDYARYMKDPIHPTLLGYSEWWTPKFLELFARLTPDA